MPQIENTEGVPADAELDVETDHCGLGFLALAPHRYPPVCKGLGSLP
jgi:hypothetical protein